MKKYWIKTFGCQMNVSDSERLRTKFEKEGYKEASKIEEADLVIVNSCSVKKAAEDRALALVRRCEKLKEKKPLEIILTGCMATKQGLNEAQKKKVNREKKKLNRVDKLQGIETLCARENYFEVAPKFYNDEEVYVPIMTGCDNFCSYCVVPYTRGRERSRETKEILAECQKVIKKGVKRIVLLGQNVNSFGKERGENLSQLLEEIDALEGEFKIRFLTNHPKDMSDELIETVAHLPKIEKFIHLPIQSGSDRILKLMNRKYTQKYYLNLVEKIRDRIGGVILTTDVIIGFPSETKKDFLETVKVFKKVNYDEAYINKYSPRLPADSSELQDDVDWKEKKERAEILRKIIDEKKEG